MGVDNETRQEIMGGGQEVEKWEKGQEVTCEVKCHADAGSEGHKEEQGGNRRKEKKKETMLKTHHNKMKYWG